MSGPKNARRAHVKKSKNGASNRPLVTVCALAAAIGAGTALILALIFTAIALGRDDPAKLAPVFGLISLAVCSAAAGAAAARLGNVPAPLCAAIGAAISAAALLLSIVPALPEVALPVPKLACAAIPVVCALAGALIAAPKRGRRRR